VRNTATAYDFSILAIDHIIEGAFIKSWSACRTLQWSAIDEHALLCGIVYSIGDVDPILNASLLDVRWSVSSGTVAALSVDKVFSAVDYCA
jgi:hypothetical protein